MSNRTDRKKTLKENENNDIAIQTQRRKMEHIEICLQEDVQCHRSTLFEEIQLIHQALPEIDKDSIDLSCNFLGLRANAPIVISAMTGGHPQTYHINRRLAEAAETLHLPIGVGSQRAAIEDPSLADTFRVVRDVAPSVPVIANIGATHVELAADAIDMIDADVLAIHLNPLQEAVQPEGDVKSAGFLDNIASVLQSVDIPVMVKETGAGISSELAQRLAELDVDAIDVGGVGGTSWAAVEYYRALRENDEMKARIGLQFWDWGIPTALSVMTVTTTTSISVVATGGIRTGLDVAKALSIGAMAAGVAYPLLRPAVTGTTEDVIAELNLMIEGLRVAMYLTGCRTPDELASRPLILGPTLQSTMQCVGINPKLFMSDRVI